MYEIRLVGDAVGKGVEPSREFPAVPPSADRARPAPEVSDTHHCCTAAGWTHYHLAGLARTEGNACQEWEHCQAAARIGQNSPQDGLTRWSLTRLARWAENSSDLSQAREHFAHALKNDPRIHHKASTINTAHSRSLPTSQPRAG